MAPSGISLSKPACACTCRDRRKQGRWKQEHTNYPHVGWSLEDKGVGSPLRYNCQAPPQCTVWLQWLQCTLPCPYFIGPPPPLLSHEWPHMSLCCQAQHALPQETSVADDYLATPGKAKRRVNHLRWFPTWHGDKSRANSQTVAAGTINLRPLFKVSKGRCTQGWAEKPRGQVGFSRPLHRGLYTTWSESLTNYWVSVNDYKLTHHVSINSTLIVLTEHNVISADIRWHVDLIIELCWLKPNTAHNNYYPQCSMPFHHILTNQKSVYVIWINIEGLSHSHVTG